MTKLEAEIADILECNNESAVEYTDFLLSLLDCFEDEYIVEELVSLRGWDRNNAVACVAACIRSFDDAE